MINNHQVNGTLKTCPIETLNFILHDKLVFSAKSARKIIVPVVILNSISEETRLTFVNVWVACQWLKLFTNKVDVILNIFLLGYQSCCLSVWVIKVVHCLNSTSFVSSTSQQTVSRYCSNFVEPSEQLLHECTMHSMLFLLQAMYKKTSDYENWRGFNNSFIFWW